MPCTSHRSTALQPNLRYRINRGLGGVDPRLARVQLQFLHCRAATGHRRNSATGHQGQYTRIHETCARTEFRPMSQEMKQRMVRIAIPVAFLVYPFAVGYPLLRVFQSGLIFYVSAVVPQYLIWPYLSYYNEASARPPFAWAMVAAHWPAVLALY